MTEAATSLEPSGPYKRWPGLREAGKSPAWPQLRVPDRFDYKVISENADFLVINKPAPLMIHPGQPGDPPTLWDHLHDLLCYERALGGKVSLINRLDRETSGLVLAAKHKSAARELSSVMESRQVRKTYLALCQGWPEWDALEVDAPIDRLGKHEPFQVWLKRGVHPLGQASLSRFHTLLRLENPPGTDMSGKFSLIQAEPHTGRMHQLRVHLSHSGLPLVGDKLYGAMGEEAFLRFIESGWDETLERGLLWSRQALHAWKLSFPWQGEILSFEAPPPAEFPRPAGYNPE